MADWGPRPARPVGRWLLWSPAVRFGHIRLGAPVAVSLLLGAGCAPQVGDPCSTAIDCSAQAQRECDLTQPGGYCTLRGCDPDGCPDGALCVQWRPQPPRSAENWCMQRCEADSDCRTDEGYRCVAPDDPRLADAGGRPLARIVDLSPSRASGRFCAAVEAGGS